MNNNLIKNLPEDPKKMMQWSWSEIEPYFKELEKFNLNRGCDGIYVLIW